MLGLFAVLNTVNFRSKSRHSAPKMARRSQQVGTCGAHAVLPFPWPVVHRLSSVVAVLFRIPHSTLRISMWGSVGGVLPKYTEKSACTLSQNKLYVAKSGTA
jgi:hypothetical protein